MKLKNKKTGAIYKIEDIDLGNNADGIWLGMNKYNSLAELNEEWEDWEEYEEPKKHYEILAMGAVMEREDAEDEIFRNQGQREIGNYFDTREEAEQAVEKLKAWKRLKEAGFEFDGIRFRDNNYIQWNIVPIGTLTNDEYKEINDDLHLLFGGEE